MLGGCWNCWLGEKYGTTFSYTNEWLIKNIYMSRWIEWEKMDNVLEAVMRFQSEAACTFHLKTGKYLLKTFLNFWIVLCRKACGY